MRQKRRVASGFGKGRAGSVAAVNEGVKTADGASDRGARTTED